MASNGRKEKFDKRLTVRLDNRHNIEITSVLDGSKTVWADAVRACMVQFETDAKEDEDLVRHTLSRLREEDLLSGEYVKRDVLVSETFRLYFSRLALNIGYDLSEYTVAAIQLYLPTFAKNPWYAINVYGRWEKRNIARSDALKNGSLKSMRQTMMQEPENGTAA